MPSRRLVLVALAPWTLTGATAAFADGERGTFGIGIDVDGEGFFLNPTLKSATITTVAPGSPAARAGLMPRDQFVLIDGHAVVGAKARDLEPYLKRSVGESVRVRLRRPSGEEYEATLVAAPR